MTVKPAYDSHGVGQFIGMRDKNILFWIECALLVSVSFSDITFGAVSGETSSFPLLLALLLMLFRSDRVDGSYLGIVSLFLSLAVISSIFNGIELGLAVASAVAYMQVAAVAYYYWRYGWLHGMLIPSAIVCIHVVVGCLQYFGFLTAALDFVFSLTLPRGSATALHDIGRGVSFWNTEPSHALQSILLPCFILLFGTSWHRLLSVSVVIATVLMSSAGVGALYLIIFCLILFLLRPVLAFAILGAVVLFVWLIGAEGRLGYISVVVYEYFSWGGWSAIGNLTLLSGFRLPSVLSSYTNLLSIPSGFGSGYWSVSVLDLMELAGYETEVMGHWVFTGEYTPVKPYSLAANLVVDFWWFGAGLVLCVSWVRLKDIFGAFRAGFLSDYQFCMIWVSLFGLLFLITAGKPAFASILFFNYLTLIGEVER